MNAIGQISELRLHSRSETASDKSLHKKAFSFGISAMKNAARVSKFALVFFALGFKVDS